MSLTRLLFRGTGQAIAAALSCLALLAFALVFRPWLERSMALHMLLQIPALACAGSLAALATSRMPWRDNGLTGAWLRYVRTYDDHGITGLVVFLLVTAYWMIPKALEHALIGTAAEAGKFLSLFLAGLILPASLTRANKIIQLFFLGNFAPMMAIAGLLYQDAPQRLCNYYLRDDQVIAGIGLVVFSIAIPLAWGLRQLGAMRQDNNGTENPA